MVFARHDGAKGQFVHLSDAHVSTALQSGHRRYGLEPEASKSVSVSVIVITVVQKHQLLKSSALTLKMFSYSKLLYDKVLAKL